MWYIKAVVCICLSERLCISDKKGLRIYQSDMLYKDKSPLKKCNKLHCTIYSEMPGVENALWYLTNQ